MRCGGCEGGPLFDVMKRARVMITYLLINGEDIDKCLYI